MAKFGNLFTGDQVKGMSIPETMISGVVGGIADSAAVSFIGNKLPIAAIAAIEIGIGIMAGGAVGGTVGNVLQNGLVITGCNRLTNWIAGGLMGVGSGSKSAANTNTNTANNSNYDMVLY